jgi:hypothetical protein
MSATSTQNEIRRGVFTPRVTIIDAERGIVNYTASDQSIDSYNEIILARGWRFNRFKKNAPFVDSHNIGSIESILGRVTAFGVENDELVETVQWAIDVPENRLAKIGWAMTVAGYPPAVSVGFQSVRSVSQYDDPTEYTKQLKRLGITEDQPQPARIHMEQEQVELSAVVIGANPNAVARSYKAGALADGDIEFLSHLVETRIAKPITGASLPSTAPADHCWGTLEFWLAVRDAIDSM